MFTDDTQNYYNYKELNIKLLFGLWESVLLCVSNVSKGRDEEKGSSSVRGSIGMLLLLLSVFAKAKLEGGIV